MILLSVLYYLLYFAWTKGEVRNPNPQVMFGNSCGI